MAAQWRHSLAPFIPITQGVQLGNDVGGVDDKLIHGIARVVAAVSACSKLGAGSHVGDIDYHTEFLLAERTIKYFGLSPKCFADLLVGNLLWPLVYDSGVLVRADLSTSDYPLSASRIASWVTCYACSYTRD